jgi:hypothetical protein
MRATAGCRRRGCACRSAKLHPLKVAWVVTRRLEAFGLVDTFRTLHPDEVAHPGRTWTTRTRWGGQGGGGEVT